MKKNTKIIIIFVVGLLAIATILYFVKKNKKVTTPDPIDPIIEIPVPVFETFVPDMEIVIVPTPDGPIDPEPPDGPIDPEQNNNSRTRRNES